MKKLMIILAVCFPLTVNALNVQKFHPVFGQEYEGVGVFASNGMTGGHVETSLYVSYLQNALEFGTSSGNSLVDSIAEHFLTGHFQVGIGLSDRLTLRASLPMNFYSKVEPISSFQPTEDYSLGDISLNATIALVDRGKDQAQKWGVGLVPFVTIPMNNEDDFFGDETFTGGGYLVLDRYLSKRHYIALNAGTRFRKKETIVNLTVGHEFLYGASYVYRLSCKAKWDIALEIIGSTTYANFFSEEVSSPYEGFLSLRKRSQSDRWEWTVGAGRAGNNGYGAPDYHAYSGVSYRFAGKNQPSRHCCQPELVIAQAIVPEPIGEFVFAIKDQNDHSLVLPIEIINQDTGESIYTVTSNRIHRNMPAGSFRAVVVEGDIEHHIDFVIIDKEKTEEKLIIEKEVKTITEYVDPIYFDVNKASIKAKSYEVLKHIVDLIATYDEISLIAISAHTDSDGKADYNLALSRKRAQSVKDHLINMGIDPKMIRFAGYGETMPKVPNTSKANKAKNRRVEFELTGKNLNVMIINR